MPRRQVDAPQSPTADNASTRDRCGILEQAEQRKGGAYGTMAVSNRRPT